MRNDVHILKRAIPDPCNPAGKASELHLGSGAPVALRLSQHYHLMSAPHHKTSWLCNRTASANGGGPAPHPHSDAQISAPQRGRKAEKMLSPGAVPPTAHTCDVPAALVSRPETGWQVHLSSPLPPVLFLLYSCPFSSLGDKRKLEKVISRTVKEVYIVPSLGLMRCPIR